MRSLLRENVRAWAPKRGIPPKIAIFTITSCVVLAWKLSLAAPRYMRWQRAFQRHRQWWLWMTLNTEKGILLENLRCRVLTRIWSTNCVKWTWDRSQQPAQEFCTLNLDVNEVSGDPVESRITELWVLRFRHYHEIARFVIGSSDQNIVGDRNWFRACQMFSCSQMTTYLALWRSMTLNSLQATVLVFIRMFCISEQQRASLWL
jgi:hypothetical protein